MSRTPGFVLPSAYSSQEELKDDLRRRSEETTGFTLFEFSDFDSELVHYGVKGMKWGVRKDEETTSRQPFTPPRIDSRVHSSTASGALEVARLMHDRYGYTVKDVKVFDKSHPIYTPELEKSFLAFVENTQELGSANEGTIFVGARDMRRELQDADGNWNHAGTGNVKGLITHENSHAIFHSTQQLTTDSRGRQKVSGGNIEARNKALKVAQKVAAREGRQIWDVSDYAMSTMERGELEAELFSAYHWGTNPPRYVQEWGKTLHKEMGVDPTPFKEVK